MTRPDAVGYPTPVDFAKKLRNPLTRPATACLGNDVIGDWSKYT
jgi:hypothetical protein